MKLFERVKWLSQKRDETFGKDSFAKELGINPHTLRGYLAEKRQHNLWPLLEKILVIHPEISRKWLYFGEGKFLMADDPDNEELQDTLDELKSTRQRVIDLEGQLAVLKGQPEALLERIEELKYTIELQKQIIDRNNTEDGKFPSSSVTKNTLALGIGVFPRDSE